VPYNVKLGLVLVLLLSACGTTASEVTVGAVPSTRAPSTSAPATADASTQVNDLDAIYQLDQFFVAAADADADPSELLTVTVPGLDIVAGDEESVGPSAISLAVVTTAIPVDLGVAIRSSSGTCFWYAFVQDEERFGSGEPCTGGAALHGSRPVVSADSPWYVVLDHADSSDSRTTSAAQAKVAQSALRNALIVAKTYMTDDGTFKGVSPAKLHAIDPNLTFVDADIPVAAARTVSVAIVGERFAAAALSENGICYWITEDVGVSTTQYGQGTPCTGTGALAATDSSWRAVD
jgi:hypothetical protein